MAEKQSNHRFVLSDYYKEKLKEIAIQGEMRAESFAVKFRFAFLALLVVFSSMGYISGRPFKEFLFQMYGVLFLLLYNILVYLTVIRTNTYKKSLKFTFSFLEITLLTFLLSFNAYSQNNPSMIYSAPMVYVYFIFIALSSIRNNLESLIFSFGLVILEYGGVMIYFFPEMHLLNESLKQVTLQLIPRFFSAGDPFFLINAVPVGIVLILLYIGVTGGLILYAIVNTSRITNEQANLIFGTEKQAILEENMRLGMELDVARQIQAMVLPREEELKSLPGLDIAARMDPATEVGGDYYEVLRNPKDGTYYFAIGDVTDHGLQSGVVMLMTQVALRTLVEGEKKKLPELLEQINSVLFGNIHNRMKDSRNLTLSVLSYNNGKLSITGQHETVLIYRKNTNTVEEIFTTELGMYVGMVEDTSSFFVQKEFQMTTGDILVLYTDGCTEAENPMKEQFGTTRLKESLVTHSGETNANAIVASIFKDIYQFIGDREVFDDITLALFKKVD